MFTIILVIVLVCIIVFYVGVVAYQAGVQHQLLKDAKENLEHLEELFKETR